MAAGRRDFDFILFDHLRFFDSNETKTMERHTTRRAHRTRPIAEAELDERREEDCLKRLGQLRWTVSSHDCQWTQDRIAQQIRGGDQTQ